jgi:deoxyribodipyrimidine photolyase
MWLQMVSRFKTALRVKGKNDRAQDNFTMSAHKSFGDISPREFVELCLAENAKRLKPYDKRLLRPEFVPAVAKAVLKTLPKKPVAEAVAA